jgi:hypothetical protein
MSSSTRLSSAPNCLTTNAFIKTSINVRVPHFHSRRAV